MATPRFRVLNGASGTIIADSKAPGINYLGKANLISTTQASGSATSLVGKRNGFSTYEFDWPTMVAAAVELRSGCTVWVQSGSGGRSGNTWRFFVHCGSDTLDADGFAQQVAPEVYCFGRLTSASGIGLRMRDDQGNLTHAYTDSGQSPMWFRNRLSEPGSGAVDTSTPRAISVMGKPAATGWPRHQRIRRNWSGTTTMFQEEWVYGWRWDAAAPGQVLLQPARSFRNRDNEAGPPRGSDSDVVTTRSSETLLLNAINY